ncbi:glycosyltransferase family A protein [Phaeobacter sp. HF9A]|uniref:glycosyltransferase family 2 protein n=1 Tax=Phaeobacter sp. HF9A TaxID=2721561 RepID=UPI0014302188|nr:glycosyltransferase family A protein [Phaeobacter sp. HF9A]NIZ15302.1 glycosyltransferase family 2 protein [Phaeobacter sp. HF9A]
MTRLAPRLTVTVAISTLGVGVKRIRLPEKHADIDYLILLQMPQDAPAGLVETLLAGRDDVALLARPDRGLSNSRNAGLEQARGDLVLFSDDDVMLQVEGILALRDQFFLDPDLVLAAGWRAERLPQNASEQRLTRFNSGRICAPEFMVRKGAVLALGIRFDPAFGLGAQYGIGEDYIFVTDILGAGGKGIAIPVVCGSHPHASTGDLWNDPILMMARKAVILRVFNRFFGRAVWLVYLWRHKFKKWALR